MTKWTPKNIKILKEPENECDKYAVAVERCRDVVGHLSKGRSAHFAKTVLYFLPASNENCCRVEVTREKSKFRRWRRTTDSLHTSFFWSSRIC